ncbi:hypothetical protein BDV12DRAFT_178362 [Aspergillus spectabilis]
MQSLLALSRIAVGLGFLTIPRPFATLISMPFSPVAAIGCRMAGGRDIVLGVLLYTSLSGSGPSSAASSTDQKKTAPDQSGSRALQRALLAGIVTDALDVACCLWCYADGTLPATPALLLAGGAALFLDLGAYLYVF